MIRWAAMSNILLSSDIKRHPVCSWEHMSLFDECGDRPPVSMQQRGIIHEGYWMLVEVPNISRSKETDKRPMTSLVDVV